MISYHLISYWISTWDPLERTKSEQVPKPFPTEMNLIGHVLEITSINMTRVPLGFIRSVWLHLLA